MLGGKKRYGGELDFGTLGRLTDEAPGVQVGTFLTCWFRGSNLLFGADSW